MRVLLISPFRGRTYESVGIRVPPLGLLYIAGALRQAGHEVALNLSENADRQENLDFSYCDAIGLTSTTSQFKKALRIAERAHDAGKTVVMGGPHATSAANEALTSGYVDFAVRGEGEETARELFEALSHRNGAHVDFSKILGLSWVDSSTGRVVHNPPRPFAADLDRLPLPARDLGGEEFHYRNKGVDGRVSPTMITTRGCPFGCKFCDVHVLAGKRFRTRNVEACVDEMEHLVTEYGATSIRIVDDIINFSTERIHELFDAVIRRGLKLKIWVMGRADMVLKDPSTAEVMAEAGVDTMFMGIESPHKRVLKSYKKGGKASADTSARAVRLLRENGIGVFGGFIIGEVSETREEIEETIQYAREINPATAQFSILTPYPGTETWEELKDRLIVHDWDWFDGLHAVFHGEYIRALDMERLLRKAYMRFYLRPQRIAKQLGALAKKNGQHLAGPRVKTMTNIFKLLQDIYPKNRELAC